MADDKTTGVIGSVYKAKSPQQLASRYDECAKFYASKVKGLVSAGKISMAELPDRYVSMPNEPLATPTIAVVLKVP